MVYEMLLIKGRYFELFVSGFDWINLMLIF